jgi:hypothetical protein
VNEGVGVREAPVWCCLSDTPCLYAVKVTLLIPVVKSRVRVVPGKFPEEFISSSNVLASV